MKKHILNDNAHTSHLVMCCQLLGAVVNGNSEYKFIMIKFCSYFDARIMFLNFYVVVVNGKIFGEMLNNVYAMNRNRTLELLATDPFSHILPSNL